MTISFLTIMQKQLNGESIALSINDVGTTGYLCIKKSIPQFKSHTQKLTKNG